MTRGEINRLVDAAAAIAKREAPKVVEDAARVHRHAGHLMHQSEKGTAARASAEQAHVMAAVALVREVDAWIGGDQPWSEAPKVMQRHRIIAERLDDAGRVTSAVGSYVEAGAARRCRRCTSPIDTTEAALNAQRSPMTVAAWLAGFCCAMCMSNDARDQQALGSAWWLKGSAQ